MKSKIITLILASITILACNNDDDNTEILDGEYSGIFERNGMISNVELSFDEGIFVGESEMIKYPAICHGGYTTTNNIIEFQNECVWTAEFDWTLILNDEWNYTLNGNTLTLIKLNGDKYELSKQ